eukprot:9076283-Alexandrium_andersonii.AAC.1
MEPHPDLVFPEEAGMWRPTLSESARGKTDVDPFRWAIRRFGSYVRVVGTGPRPIPSGPAQ